MAAKDKVCGNNLVALKDLDLDAWIDKPGDVDCTDKKWIGAPDPTDGHKNRLDLDPCDPMAWTFRSAFIIYLWYFCTYSVQLSFLSCFTWRFKEELIRSSILGPTVVLARPPVAADSA
tara:strand:+ start:342 stop:695 length:354 start_codon:yes stop_codon:yes gene_type:complete